MSWLALNAGVVVAVFDRFVMVSDGATLEFPIGRVSLFMLCFVGLLVVLGHPADEA